MTFTHYQITVNGKIYGYWLDKTGRFTDNIRSESNPDKTPYLKNGSKTYNTVLNAIRKAM